MKRFLLLPVLLILLFGNSGYAAYSTKGEDAFASGDYATALKEWKPLAEQGNAKAQAMLGAMYLIGQGVTKDYKAALKWLKLAAEQGDADAQIMLGGMYAIGQGVTQDFTRSFMWLDIAASQGQKKSVEIRNKVEKEMTPADVSKAQELVLECVAKNYKGC